MKRTNIFLAHEADKYFRMSLRLYSDEIQLAAIAESLDFPRKHFHIKGQPMRLNGRFAGKISDKNYVSFVETKIDDPSEIAPWIEQNIAAIVGVPEIVALLLAKQVTATLWIAMFGETPTALPYISADIVQKVADCGAQLFLENYTVMDPDHGNPQKHWRTGAP